MGKGPKIFSGLNEKRMSSSGGGKFADKTAFKIGDTVTLQFLDPISDFREYDQHQFLEEGKWRYVPCGGDSCDLCGSVDDKISRQNYRFSCNVWNHTTARVEVFDGPKSLGAMIARKYRRVADRAGESKAADAWREKVWDVSKLNTQPVTFEIEEGDPDPVSSRRYEGKKWDIDKSILDSFNYYWGAEANSASVVAKEDKEAASSLDDSSWDKATLKAKSDEELVKIAKSIGVKGAKKMSGKELVKAILGH